MTSADRPSWRPSLIERTRSYGHTVYFSLNNKQKCCIVSIATPLLLLVNCSLFLGCWNCLLFWYESFIVTHSVQLYLWHSLNRGNKKEQNEFICWSGNTSPPLLLTQTHNLILNPKVWYLGNGWSCWCLMSRLGSVQTLKSSSCDAWPTKNRPLSVLSRTQLRSLYGLNWTEWPAEP